MPQSGSNAYRLRFTVAVAVLAVVIAAAVWTLTRSADDSSSAPATTTANAANASPEEHRVDKDSEAVASKSLEHAKHTDATSPLPPPGMPLAQIYDVLKHRAEAGDEAAATRLFHEVHRCNVVEQDWRVLAEAMPLAATNENRSNSSIGIVRGSQVDVKLVRAVSAFVQANSARCEGVTVEQLESITPLTLRVAQLGDLKALDCYVGSEFDRMEGILDHPEWIEQYRTQVPALVESALRRGDWFGVELLRQAYSGASESSPLSQLLGSDPAMAYRLLRLERLGATGNFADELERRLVAAARELTPGQVANADAWAGDFHSRYFTTASNDAFDGSDICEISDDGID
jgi:hypothetical protein